MGKIVLGRVGDYVNFKKSNDDVIWVIVRSTKALPEQVRAIAEVKSDLAPSYDLFTWYRDRDKAGEWGYNDNFIEYAKRFVKEIAARDTAKALLREAEKLVLSGKTLHLLCFCRDYKTCHRSLVGRILDKRGLTIKWG